MNDRSSLRTAELTANRVHAVPGAEQESRKGDFFSLEKKDIYREAGNTIRHYSNATRTVRTLSIAQAGILTYAISRLTSVQQYDIAIAGCALGIILTIVLYFLHRNYYDYMVEMMQFTADFEKANMESRDYGHPFTGGPWSRAFAMWQHKERPPEEPLPSGHAMLDGCRRLLYQVLLHRRFIINYAIYFILAIAYAIYVWLLLPYG